MNLLSLGHVKQNTAKTDSGGRESDKLSKGLVGSSRLLKGLQPLSPIGPWQMHTRKIFSLKMKTKNLLSSVTDLAVVIYCCDIFFSFTCWSVAFCFNEN